MNFRTISKLMLGLALVAFTATGCKKDKCKDKNCGNGSCVDGSCVCNTGYEGSECGTEKRSKFLGSWSATENCTSGNYSWTMTSTASSQGITAIIFNNFAGFNGINVSATVNSNGTSLTIPNQTLSGATFSGSAQITGNIMTLTYSLTSQGQTDNCTATCTRQ
ncbi:MAG: hypothetical protein IT228_07545 [Flavobacteriales bacterium]|nr:hypothetical protein [Flavobacteriales bacterium]NUQ16137.1 hypothetical protein [Flavobacteriales bacterium]